MYADVVDKGSGIYTATFTVPAVTSSTSYTLTAGVRGVIGSLAFTANTYTLAVKYASTFSSFSEQARIAYAKVGTNYIIGIASDENAAVATDSSATELKVSSVPSKGIIFIMMTNPIGNPDVTAKYLNRKTFLDDPEPAFGYALTDREHKVKASLSYDDFDIIGSTTAGAGRHSLLVKNAGTNSTSGKKKIEVSII